jgi:hypothetical protein
MKAGIIACMLADDLPYPVLISIRNAVVDEIGK